LCCSTSKFEQADLDVFLDEADYYDYKSWYLTFYDRMKRDRERGKESVLVDVDFNIELIRTDKINVVYILNLLKDINRNDKEEMKKSVDLILREIERTDNEKMRYKKDLMADFINLRFFDLDPEEDIIKAYEDYEKERMITDIDEFSKENDVPREKVTDILVQYFANDKAVTKETIRIELNNLDLGLIQMTKRIKAIQLFMSEMYNKYTAEGD
jgi:type I restriction enzyme R subunit